MITRTFAARVLLTVAIVGVAVSLAGSIIAWSFVGNTERTARQSLDITTDAVRSVADTITVAQSMLATVSDALSAVESAVASTGASFEASQSVLDGIAAFAGGPLPATIETVSGTLPGLADVGDAVDRALRALARTPIGVPYNPPVPFGEAVRQLASGLETLPAQLRGLAGTLTAATGPTRGLASDLEALRRNLGTATTQLHDARGLLDRYAATARAAAELTNGARQDVRVQSRNGRILVTLGGIGFTAMQSVPLLLALMWWRRNDMAVDSVPA